jgi:hypothetical protein
VRPNVHRFMQLNSWQCPIDMPLMCARKLAQAENTLHIGDNRWDEKAGLRRDAVGSQVINVL